MLTYISLGVIVIGLVMWVMMKSSPYEPDEHVEYVISNLPPPVEELPAIKIDPWRNLGKELINADSVEQYMDLAKWCLGKHIQIVTDASRTARKDDSGILFYEGRVRNIAFNQSDEQKFPNIEFAIGIQQGNLVATLIYQFNPYDVSDSFSEDWVVEKFYIDRKPEREFLAVKLDLIVEK